MEMILGYIGAVIIGITLGLIGGGGSILTVPVLVYLMGFTPVLGTAYSLFIVGVTAIVGAYRMYGQGFLDIKMGIIFGIPAFIAVFLTRKFLVPNIPEHVLTLGTFELTRAAAIMGFFALVMLICALSMIRGNRRQAGHEETDPPEGSQINVPLVALEGVVVGSVTGIVGAGGGFLIVPALVIMGKLPMKTAVGTSLMIISAKSLIGFVGDVMEQSIDWAFLGSFSLLAIGGILLGSWLNQYIEGEKLRKGFGWFVMVMAVVIIYKELV